MQRCSWFLASKYTEVSPTDTSPFRLLWLNIYGFLTCSQLTRAIAEGSKSVVLGAFFSAHCKVWSRLPLARFLFKIGHVSLLKKYSFCWAILTLLIFIFPSILLLDGPFKNFVPVIIFLVWAVSVKASNWWPNVKSLVRWVCRSWEWGNQAGRWKAGWGGGGLGLSPTIGHSSVGQWQNCCVE